MKYYTIPFIVLGLIIGGLGYWANVEWQKYQSKVEDLQTEEKKSEEVQRRIQSTKSQKQLLQEQYSELLQFYREWRDALSSGSDGAAATIISEWDDTARKEFDLATGNRSSETGIEVSLVSPPNTAMMGHEVAISVTGQYESIMSFLGWAEKQNPAGRWKRITISSSGEQVSADLRMFLPYRVQIGKTGG